MSFCVDEISAPLANASAHAQGKTPKSVHSSDVDQNVKFVASFSASIEA